MLPAYVGDLHAYQGDAYTLDVPFTDADGNPIDVSGSTFTATVKGANGGIVVGALEWTVDMTDAATGTIHLTLTGAGLAAVTGPGAEREWPLIWDLAESGLWDRTLFEGRIVLRTQA
jgi:hypothetical protein